MSRVTLHRIELTAAENLLPSSKLSLSFPETNPCVVLGENGSGKSLITVAITAALDPQTTPILLKELAEAGLYTIVLTLSQGDKWFDLHVDVPSGTRSVQLHSGGSEDHHNGSAPGFMGDELLFKNGELFTNLHCILDGEISEPGRELLDGVAEALRMPLRHELDSWTSRLTALTGDEQQAGKLSEIQQKHSETKANCERVRSLLQRIESVRQRRDAMSAELQELLTMGAILKAEREEIERTVGLAERAARVESWLSEVHRDVARVEALRDEHEKTQEELDSLAGKFRGAPESFPELLDEYESATAARQQKQAAWDELEASRASLQDEILDVERDLSMLKSPQNEGIQARIDELQSEVKADELLLVNLLRDRISLLRKREGLEQRLHAEFAEVARLDRPVLEAVRKQCSGTPVPAQPSEATLQLTEDLRLLQKKLDDLEHKLQEDYGEFNKLSEHAEDEILDLHVTKSAISESSDLLESLQARKADANAVGKSPRWIIGIIAAAVIVGLPFGILLGWDVGLFAALVGSGFVWMLYRNTNKAAEKRVLELTQHENKVRQRWKSAVEARTMLEQRLGPLADLKKGEATEKLGNYLSMMNERAQLRHSFNELQQQIERIPAVPVEEPLPVCFAGMKYDAVLAMIAEYETLNAEKKTLDQQWKAFESDGEIAGQIEQLEGRVSRRKGEVEALQKSVAEELRSYSSRKQILTSKLNELRHKLPDSAEIEKLSREINELSTKLSGIADASGSILVYADAHELREAWLRFGSLKQRQRTLKDELSACLSLDEIRSRKSILTDELHEVTGKLADLDPLYLKQGNAAHYANKYENQLESISRQISENLSQTETVRQELDTVDTTSLTEQVHSLPSLETLESDLQNYDEQLENVQREIRTTQELVESLSREIDKVESELPVQIESSVNQAILRFFGEDFGTVHYSGDEWMLKTTSNQSRRLRTLSRGQADMVRLMIRIAILDLLDSIENDFVVWDDVLGNLDELRIGNMRNLLEMIAEKRQVLLFTRDSRLSRENEAVQLKIQGEVRAEY